VLDSETLTWFTVTANGNAPSPRDKLSSVSVGSVIYFFGGFGPQQAEDDDDDEDEAATFGWFNDIHTLDTATLIWEKKEVSGTTPTPRAASSLCVIGSKLFLFGGRDTTQRVNDLHTLDITSLHWDQPKVYGSKPEPRSFHSTITLGSNLFLFGGLNRSNVHLNDVHILTFSGEEIGWLQPQVNGIIPARGFHTTFTIDNKFYVFGGSSNFDATIHECTRYYNDLYYLETTSIQQGIQVPFPASSNETNIQNTEPNST